MNPFHKIIWHEGLMLNQQIFQVHECSNIQARLFQLQMQSQNYWGLWSLELDDLLKQGQFRILACHWILKNGEHISHCHEDDELSLDLSREHQHEINIYLNHKSGSKPDQISGYIKTQDYNWKTYEKEFSDIYDPERKNRILIARPVLSLSTSLPANTINTIQVAKIIRNNYGGYELSQAFIPTVLQFNLSPILVDSIKNFYIKVFSKYKALLLNNSFEAKIFAQALARFMMGLKILEEGGRHPFEYYQLLSGVLADLSIFDKDLVIEILPKYEHYDLSATFEYLHNSLEKALAISLAKQFLDLNFIKKTENVFLSDEIQSQYLSGYEFYLIVKVSSDTLNWVNEFISYNKLGASQKIETLVASALPGIGLRHVQIVPAGLPNKSGWQYFHLQKNNIYWQQLIEDKKLALFLAQQFEQAVIELVMLKEDHEH